MRASGICSALMTASVMSLVTGGCVAPAVRSTTRAPTAASASVGAAAPDSAGYTADGTLEAVAATSAVDAWAVGYLGRQGTPLIVHWNGTAWRSIPAGAPARTILHSVAATSPGNAWALGETYRTVSSQQMPVILHWDGTAWRQVPLPRLTFPAGGGAQLNAVSATSAGNAWAAGVFLSRQGSPGAGFVLHWNGSSWSQVPSAPASAGDPIAVAATATDHAWLLGAVTGLWNGRDWMTVPIPLLKKLPDGRGGTVSALAASGHTAWVAGQYCTTTTACEDGRDLPMILRWTGHAWTLTPVPGNNIVIFGLTVTSSSSVWAVGYEQPRTTVILHWNGSTWS